MVNLYQNRLIQCEKYKQYAKKPYRLVEDMLGVKLKWWQKLQIMFLSNKRVDESIRRYINKHMWQ